MSDDDKTEVAVRPSSASVRLFNGLGGVELGVRHTGHKAMVYVRFRKLVLASWWKAPAALGKTPFGQMGAGAAESRPQVQHEARKPAVLPGAGIVRGTVTSHEPAAPVPGSLRPTAAAPAPAASAAPAAPVVPGAVVLSAEPASAPAASSATAASSAPPDDSGPNVMHRWWRRVSEALKPSR